MNLRIYIRLLVAPFAIALCNGGVDKRQITVGQYFFPITASFPDFGWNAEAHSDAEPIYDEIIQPPGEDLEPETKDLQKRRNIAMMMTQTINRNHLISSVPRVPHNSDTIGDLKTTKGVPFTMNTLKNSPNIESIDKKIIESNESLSTFESNLSDRPKLLTETPYRAILMNDEKMQQPFTEDEPQLLKKTYDLLIILQTELLNLKKESSKIIDYLKEIRSRLHFNSFTKPCAKTGHRSFHHSNLNASRPRNLATASSKLASSRTSPLPIYSFRILHPNRTFPSRPIVHIVNTTHALKKTNLPRYEKRRNNAKRPTTVSENNSRQVSNQKAKHRRILHKNHRRNLIIFTKLNDDKGSQSRATKETNNFRNRNSTIRASTTNRKLISYRNNKNINGLTRSEMTHLAHPARQQTTPSLTESSTTNDKVSRAKVPLSRLYHTPLTRKNINRYKQINATSSETSVSVSLTPRSQEMNSSEMQRRIDKISKKSSNKTIIITGDRFITSKTPISDEKQPRKVKNTREKIIFKPNGRFGRTFSRANPRISTKRRIDDEKEFKGLWPQTLLESIDIDYL